MTLTSAVRCFRGQAGLLGGGGERGDCWGGGLLGGGDYCCLLAVYRPSNRLVISGTDLLNVPAIG